MFSTFLYQIRQQSEAYSKAGVTNLFETESYLLGTD